MFMYVNQGHEKRCLQGEEQMVRGKGTEKNKCIKEKGLAQIDLL